MKKLLTLVLVPLFYAASAQTIISQLYTLPPAGIQQLKDEYPYIRSQQLQGSSWEDYQLHTWIKAPNSDSIGIRLTSGHQTDNSWKISQSEKDSFILDNKGRVSININDIEYIFSTDSYRYKTKFVYTYGSTSKPTKVRIQYAEPPGSNSYYNSAEVTLFYDQDGRRLYDSTYLYGNGAKVRDYFIYDNNGALINQFTLRGMDTIKKLYLTYDGDRIATAYLTALNTTTDEWEEKAADTLTYDAEGHLLHHIRWSTLILASNPDEPYFSRISNEFYHYNAEGKLDENIYQGGTSGTWIDLYKINIAYDNSGKAVIAHQYQKSGGDWSIEAFTRYLFGIPTGMRENVSASIPVNIYPNPCKDVLTITLDQPASIQNVMLYNANSKCVYSSEKGDLSIDLTGYTDGIYFLHVVTEQGIANQRVLVQH
jgi:hypothetical protein